MKQRELLNEKLGFSQANKLGINININDLIALEDMKSENKNCGGSSQMVIFSKVVLPNFVSFSHFPIGPGSRYSTAATKNI